MGVENGALELQGISKVFPTPDGTGLAGLKHMDLRIEAGEGFSLLGPSGCGKTTTLRLIGGFESTDQGRIVHCGEDITARPPHLRDIRTVFQRYALFPHLNVRQNIGFSLKLRKENPETIKRSVNEVLEMLEITRLADRPISKLSGGEQQRVALARALVSEPSVILFDEPLSALDLKLRERMQLELLALRSKLGSTFIFVTHDQTEAMVLSDRIGVMKDGELVQVGSPEEIYFKPKSMFVATFIGQANFLGPRHRELVRGSIDRMPLPSDGQSIMIRPEHTTPKKLGTKLDNGWAGMEVVLQEAAFLGQDWLLKVLDQSGQSQLMKSPGFDPPPAEKGESFIMAWEAEDAWSVQNDSSPL
jgi:ABC-type Fe3+/spermidine/putrescine transport system ATPase subunit